MAYEHLLSPGNIGPLKLKNRIVWASHATDLSEESGEVSDKQIDYFARRAKGGVGLIVSELLQAGIEIDPLRIVPLTLRIDDDRFIPKLARLTKAVHDNGAKIGVQMTPGAGAQALGGPWVPGPDVRAVTPSGVLALGRHTHAMNPRALANEEVKRMVELFGRAAVRVKEAGFDMIELHAHGGYLIHEFLSPYFNKRTDEYGGSIDNRCRFLLELVASVRRAIGPEVALAVKLSVEDFLPGGWDAEQSRVLVRKLQDAGVDAIGASSGVHGGRNPATPPYFYPMGTFLPFAAAIRNATSLPLYTSGRLDDPALAEQVLRERKIDFVQVARGLIADPDWAQKITDGRVEEIRPCLACNHCRQQLVILKPLRCSVNAAAGREAELDTIVPARTPRRVLVVGGGPAGMEAARVASLAGHDVTLCEKRRRLGGLMLVAGIHNERIAEFNDWLVRQIGKLPVKLRLNTEVTPELVAETKPDIVLLATGGKFVKPDIPGIDGNNVFKAADLLEILGGGTPRTGMLLRLLAPVIRLVATPSLVRFMLGLNYPVRKSVAVIGGQFAGCSLALLLAHKGKSVTILEESEQYGKEVEANTLDGLNDTIAEKQVQVMTSTKVLEITGQGVVVMGKDGKKSLVQAGSVFVALDLAPEPGPLAGKLGDKVSVRTIGDANSFLRITNAVSEGYVTARDIS